MPLTLYAGLLTAVWAWSARPRLSDSPERFRAGGLELFCGVGVALGLSSLVWFWVRVVAGPSPSAALIAETLVVAALLAATRRGAGDASNRGPDGGPGGSGRWTRPVVAGAGLLLAASVVALGAVLREFQRQPHGGWDGWAVWNLKARFLFRDASGWWNLCSDLYQWIHPDYPLLLPATVARAWSYLGHEAAWVPRGLALFYTAATVWLIWAGVRRLIGPGQAVLAGLLLLAHAKGVLHGASQYADTPLGFYFLLSLLLVALHDAAPPPRRASGLLVLAGLAAGLAAWTKNEGLLFALALLLARGPGSALRGDRSAWPAATARLAWGMAPGLISLALFRLLLAPGGDLFTARRVPELFARLVDPARWRTIAAAFAEQYLAIGRGVAVLLACYVILALARQRSVREAAGLPLAVVLLVQLGYFGIYLLTPQDLAWHLGHSLDRLLIQLWPSTILSLLLLIRPAEPPSGSASTVA